MRKKANDSGKRAKQSTIPVLEPIALKFVELAVLLGKGKMAREALYSYKVFTYYKTIFIITRILHYV